MFGAAAGSASGCMVVAIIGLWFLGQKKTGIPRPGQCLERCVAARSSAYQEFNLPQHEVVMGPGSGAGAGLIDHQGRHLGFQNGVEIFAAVFK